MSQSNLPKTIDGVNGRLQNAVAWLQNRRKKQSGGDDEILRRALIEAVSSATGDAAPVPEAKADPADVAAAEKLPAEAVEAAEAGTAASASGRDGGDEAKTRALGELPGQIRALLSRAAALTEQCEKLTAENSRLRGEIEQLQSGLYPVHASSYGYAAPASGAPRAPESIDEAEEIVIRLLGK